MDIVGALLIAFSSISVSFREGVCITCQSAAFIFARSVLQISRQAIEVLNVNMIEQHTRSPPRMTG